MLLCFMFLQLHILADIKVIADILLTLLEQVIEKQNFSHNKKKKISIPFFFFLMNFVVYQFSSSHMRNWSSLQNDQCLKPRGVQPFLKC